MQKADAILAMFVMGCLLFGWGDSLGARWVGLVTLFLTGIMLLLSDENGKK